MRALVLVGGVLAGLVLVATPTSCGPGSDPCGSYAYTVHLFSTSGACFTVQQTNCPYKLMGTGDLTCSTGAGYSEWEIELAGAQNCGIDVYCNDGRFQTVDVSSALDKSGCAVPTTPIPSVCDPSDASFDGPMWGSGD